MGQTRSVLFPCGGDFSISYYPHLILYSEQFLEYLLNVSVSFSCGLVSLVDYVYQLYSIDEFTFLEISQCSISSFLRFLFLFKLLILFKFAVPLDTRFSDIEIKCDDMVICSEIKPSSLERHEWCRITKNLGQGSATIHNQRYANNY